MSQFNQLKVILYRKVKINIMAKKADPRSFDINLKEISREIRCSISHVEEMLRELQFEKEIKRLTPIGFNKENYTLTVLENSSIMTQNA